jgi:hypothetical protein
MVGKTIEYIGVGGSRNLGHLEFLADTLMITTLNEEEITIKLKLKNRNDYLYTDYIGNHINGFKIVCHIIKANEENRDVLITLFLHNLDEYKVIQNYIENMKTNNDILNVTSSMKPINTSKKEALRGGWLSYKK